MPVGAGLLAKAVYQATMMPTDTPSSRASPLPQGIWGVRSDRIEQRLMRLAITVANDAVAAGALGFVERLVGVVEP